MAILYLAFSAYTIHTAEQLPDRVATHFNGLGSIFLVTRATSSNRPISAPAN